MSFSRTNVTSFVLLSFVLGAPALQAQTIWFVDDDGDPAGGCTSWAEACPELQRALSLAGPDDQIWVAEGTYRPDFDLGTELHTGDREASFQLLSGVAVYGGFDGSEATLAERAGLFDLTVLSGDLLGDDGPEFANNSENSYHVVVASGAVASSLLDGLTITGGNADGSGGHGDGGGLYNAAGSLNVINCRFTQNTAKSDGAGMFSFVDATLTDCTFVDNASNRGGGMRTGGNVELDRCKFIGNAAIPTPGHGPPRGGGVYAVNGSLEFSNCLFTGNVSGDRGGGSYLGQGTSVLLNNCTFSRNASDGSGGGIFVWSDSLAMLNNCILFRNTASGGVSQIFGSADVRYSDIQGGWAGTGNIDQNPLFVDADGDDGIIGTEDDDLHLSPGSPAIDAADNTAVPLGMVADLDGGARFVDDLATPDTGNPDGILPIVDMGAYEFGSQDCNLNGTPDDEDISNRTSDDCNANGIPDECEPSLDCNDNGTQDICDVTNGTSDDCNSNSVPDECEPDCNDNDQADSCDLADGTSGDCNENAVPDECELDTDSDDIIDVCDNCELFNPDQTDCQPNGVGDVCDIAAETSDDSNSNGVPDECEVLATAWVQFENQTATRLMVVAELGSDDEMEKDYAWGDLDGDGDVDLVVVRMYGWTNYGPRRNVLLLNEDGILVDRTAEYATDADDGGMGFLDVTNDGDVALVDVDGDNWLDVVTAVACYSCGGVPESVTQPRVYINKGNDAGGNWLGLRYEQARIPSFGQTPNFIAIGFGDVSGDAAPDLYFTDATNTLEDRLLINDGAGFFVDETEARVSPWLTDSTFGAHALIADPNHDGYNDIFKVQMLGAYELRLGYNDPDNVGHFEEENGFVISDSSAQFIAADDLNNDGLLDLAITREAGDVYMLNRGNGPNGQATWQPGEFPLSTFGRGSNLVIADLDNDGWKDVLVADVDVEFPICSRVSDILRNNADPPNVTFTADAGNIPEDMLVGVHDIAVFDINGDTWLDLVLGRCESTEVWIQIPPPGPCESNADCDDADPCTTDSCSAESCEFLPRLYGDANNDALRNIVDVICAARVIFQNATICGEYLVSSDEIDLAPSVDCGDGMLNIVDVVVHARAVFQGAVDLCCE